MKKSIIACAVVMAALFSTNAFATDKVIAYNATRAQTIASTDLTVLTKGFNITLSDQVSIAASDNTTNTAAGIAGKHRKTANFFTSNTDGGSMKTNPAGVTAPAKDADVSATQSTFAANS